MTIDFMEKVLFEYEDSLRRTGRTTNAIERAKKENATLVCVGIANAFTIAKEHGIKTVSLERFYSENYHRGRKPEKYIFDNFAEYKVILHKLQEARRILEEKKPRQMW